MKTLLQCIDDLIEKITVTDRQEDNIKNSFNNITNHLTNKERNLFVKEVFTNGSYERDTIIRPLNDIDLFAVLKKDDWKDQYGNLPNPKNVLSKIKNYLNGLNDYKGKVKQDRPCVTIELSDKDFDILPSFEVIGGGYQIPDYNLESWTFSYPEQLTRDLNDTHKLRKYRLKPVIKAIKYWNKENSKIIPSYHIEEVAINIFKLNDFVNYEEAIRLWFNNAEYNLLSTKFKSNTDYNASINKIKKVKDKLNDAKKKYDDSKEGEAIKIWKEVFGKEFPTLDIEEAKKFSENLSEGALKITKTGTISATLGNNIPLSKGFYGDEK